MISIYSKHIKVIVTFKQPISLILYLSSLLEPKESLSVSVVTTLRGH